MWLRYGKVDAVIGAFSYGPEGVERRLMEEEEWPCCYCGSLSWKVAFSFS